MWIIFRFNNRAMKYIVFTEFSVKLFEVYVTMRKDTKILYFDVQVYLHCRSLVLLERNQCLAVQMI